MAQTAMQDKINKLSKFGLVKTCKIINEQIVTIVITDGFSENATKTFQFIEIASNLFSDYPIIETCITEENLAVIVLKKRQ